jgi:hypothetical protein
VQKDFRRSLIPNGGRIQFTLAGVPAGMIMAMVKSAARMVAGNISHIGSPLVAMLHQVHQVTANLSAGNGGSAELKLSNTLRQCWHQCLMDFSGQTNFSHRPKNEDSLFADKSGQQKIGNQNGEHAEIAFQHEPVGNHITAEIRLLKRHKMRFREMADEHEGANLQWQ